MSFQPAILYPIAVVLSIINLVAVGFAVGQSQPWHAAMHAAVALAFGLGARRLRQGPGGSELQAPVEVLETLDALEAEVSKMRQELSETQERLDFTERVLAQGPEARRVDPQR